MLFLIIDKELYMRGVKEKYVVSRPHRNELDSEEDNLLIVYQQYNELLDLVLSCFPQPQHKEAFLLTMALKVKHRTILLVIILTF